MLPRPAFALILLATLSACVGKQERDAKGPVPRLDKLFPDKIMSGQGFNVQANGQSAMGATGAFFAAGARLQVNGHPLPTTVANANTISALMPANLLPKDGVYAITVEMPDGRLSNALPLVVLPSTGPAPELTKLFPDNTKAGVGFNLQPNGRSALGLTGTNFLPGAKVLLNGEAQETNFGDIDRLGCFFDQKFHQKAGRIRVTVRNPDGKESKPLDFNVN
jgi:hypothetical protein